MRRVRSLPLSVAVLMVMMSVACTHTPPNTTPQASIAHYGVDVVSGINTFQNFIVTSSAGATPRLSVAAATPIMDKIRTTLVTADRLSAALKEYDALTVGMDKQSKAAQIQTLLTAITTAGLDTLASSLPPGLAAEGTRLVGNVNTSIGTIRAALIGARL